MNIEGVDIDRGVGEGAKDASDEGLNGGFKGW